MESTYSKSKRKHPIPTSTVVLIGMFTALTAVLSILQIPTISGVPFTLQTFAIALNGYVLGWKYGTIATMLYVVLGAIGIPVYAGMTSGLGILFGIPGGFLFGFIPLSFFTGLKTFIELKIQKKSISLSLFFGMIGLFFCHLFGCIQFSLFSHTSVWQAALAVSMPYLLKDVLSIAGAYIISGLLKARVPFLPLK